MKYTVQNIWKLYLDWRSKMNSSWERGKSNLKFIQCGEQNDEYSHGSLEKLTFNVLDKFLKIVQANGKNLDLSVSLKSINPITQNKEKKVFQSIFEHIMFSYDNSNAFRESLDDVYSFGQSVLYVKRVRENNDTLNEVLKIENIKDPTSVFFDCSAPSRSYHDGKFCGRVIKIKRENLIRQYKKLKSLGLPEYVTVIDFWYRTKKREKYVKLNTGEYKLERLIDPLRDVIVDKTKKVEGTTPNIGFMRVVKEIDYVLIKEELNSCMLPMVMNYGGFVKTSNFCYESFPFGYHLRDAQKLLNYTGSTAADILKSTTADKWLFSNENLASNDAHRNAEEINEREGGFNFTGNIQTIRREQSQQLPPSIVSFFEQTRSILEDLVGSYFDNSRSHLKALSGVAINKMFDRMDLTQSNVIVAHLNTLNIVGEILKQHIACCYHQTRKIVVANSSGKEQTIIINEDVEQPNGKHVVKNPISDLLNSYNFQVNISPSRKMQSQNIVEELTALYKIDPRYAELTADIYVKHLNIPNADVISKRVAAQIPSELIDYSDGEINKEQYDRIVQQKMEEAKRNDPKIMTDVAKMHIEQYKAETARNKEQASAALNRVKVLTDTVNSQQKNENDKNYIELERVKTMLSVIEKKLMELMGAE
jgi:hypothetical protein